MRKAERVWSTTGRPRCSASSATTASPPPPPCSTGSWKRLWRRRLDEASFSIPHGGNHASSELRSRRRPSRRFAYHSKPVGGVHHLEEGTQQATFVLVPGVIFFM